MRCPRLLALAIPLAAAVAACSDDGGTEDVVPELSETSSSTTESPTDTVPVEPAEPESSTAETAWSDFLAGQGTPDGAAEATAAISAAGGVTALESTPTTTPATDRGVRIDDCLWDPALSGPGLWLSGVAVENDGDWLVEYVVVVEGPGCVPASVNADALDAFVASGDTPAVAEPSEAEIIGVGEGSVQVLYCEPEPANSSPGRADAVTAVVSLDGGVWTVGEVSTATDVICDPAPTLLGLPVI